MANKLVKRVDNPYNHSFYLALVEAVQEGVHAQWGADATERKLVQSIMTYINDVPERGTGDNHFKCVCKHCNDDHNRRAI
jgi:hypothetical protein